MFSILVFLIIVFSIISISFQNYTMIILALFATFLLIGFAINKAKKINDKKEKNMRIGLIILLTIFFVVSIVSIWK